MHQTLYRKYRPNDFTEVVGQKIIVKTLENAIKNNMLSHAYIFTGPRGTGKTSIAKILAKTINCSNLNGIIPCNNCDSCNQIINNQSIDIIEIDAASNNGVDEIRELRNKVSLVPSIGKYKVYIIDEVHMLTTGAFNALLKTLEEPPAHIIFILATTDPHKVPLTILSRCQRFDFKKITFSEMKKRLEKIVNEENVKIDDLALNEIIRLSDGGMRDALGILDQLLAYCDGNVKIDDVYEINGTITNIQMKNFVENIISLNSEEVFKLVDKFDENGKNYIKIAEELQLFLKNILLNKKVPNYFQSLGYDCDLYDLNITSNNLINLIEIINKSIIDMKESDDPKLIFELLLLKLLNQNSSEQKEISREIKNNETNEEEQKYFSNLNEKANVKEISNYTYSNLDEIKKIRLNNTLCYFNKKYYLDIKNKLNDISNYLVHPNYSKSASMILDGEVKAAGNKYIIFVYKSDRLANMFNMNLESIENMLKEILKDDFKVIATTQNEWDVLKDVYNNKKKNFEYIEEPSLKLQKEEKFQINEIESDFNDIIEYS